MLAAEPFQLTKSGIAMLLVEFRRLETIGI